MNESIKTVKADAVHAAFSAKGRDVVWAVVDSGIDKDHPHFRRHQNLALNGPIAHRDFTGNDDPLTDGFGHGTRVAGIIAGELRGTSSNPIRAVTRYRNGRGDVVHQGNLAIRRMAGMAPECKLLSLRVLNDRGEGDTGFLIAALDYIKELNGTSRKIRVHGVNLSLGYPFSPEWFACGQSPLCGEVDQLVRSGVVVVAAAGNTGYGYNQVAFAGPNAAGLGVTINDPGNAARAITVGSTHRNMPHAYGVSYFSSKGPTGDGRDKPDLVAPGEKILSCATGKKKAEAERKTDLDPQYVEDSGTSMAAPHVSGAIAAFLSARHEFIGQPERVKDIFVSNATDLHRDRHFQGSGLVDVMRAIQSV